MQNLTPYLPLLTSITSLCTALVVAVIGFRFSRSIEAGKVRAAYLNYALQKILDEYIKLDPSINVIAHPGVDHRVRRHLFGLVALPGRH